MRHSIKQREPDDPYGDIIVLRGTTAIAYFPLDDAPVQDFNSAQWLRARMLVDMLNRPSVLDQ